MTPDNKPLTKEEIREKHLRNNGLAVNNSPVGKSIQRAAYAAMDEWAMIQSIEFAEWINGEGWVEYDGKDRWICPSNNNNVISTQSLHKLFLEDRDSAK